MPSRQDPFGEYEHVKPVPIHQAVSELKEANLSVSLLVNELGKAKTALGKIQEQYEEAKKVYAEKSYQLSLSALEQ